MDWRISLGFCFLVVISVIMWGASQGWYSKVVKKVHDVTTTNDCPPSENCDEYKKKIAMLEGRIFELETELNAKNAKISDLTRKLAELMDIINQLTTSLQNAEARIAELEAALKAAQEDLARCRQQLNECRAELLARRVVNEKCHMTPETNNLIR